MARCDLDQLYREMLLIRRSEEMLGKLYADGMVPGFVHLSIGQEAVPVGVSCHLRKSDSVSSNHRGHGHSLAKGVPLEGFFAEVLGRETGLCKGRGGSMHVADFSIGMLGANGIVAAGVPITTGSALAKKLQGEGDISVVYLGDGALAEGVVYECMNIAALWQLPLLFVCENNGWSEFSPSESQLATDLEKLAAAFHINYQKVDGNDVEAVSTAVEAMVDAMRANPAPAVIECATTRVRGHFEGDRQDYRNSDELAELEQHDPLLKARDRLQARGADASWFEQLAVAVDEEIASALNAALSAAQPGADRILDDVYTLAGGQADD